MVWECSTRFSKGNARLKRGEHDDRVNLNAELEFRHLNSKRDLLPTHQWQWLREIQQVQTDLMREIADARRRK